MEDALALAEIREKRELTQTDIAQVLEMQIEDLCSVC